MRFHRLASPVVARRHGARIWLVLIKLADLKKYEWFEGNKSRPVSLFVLDFLFWWLI